MDNIEHKIKIVGCGPGSPDLLTGIGRQAIREADVVVGIPRLLENFAFDTQQQIPVSVNIEAVLSAIAEHHPARKVTVLVTGDPGLASLAKPVLRRFGLHCCEVLPGISSVQVAFARFGLDWLDARILNAHARVPQVSPGELMGCAKFAILAGHQDALEWMADLHAQLSEHRVYVCEDLSLETERIRHLTSGDLLCIAVSPRTIVLFVKEELPL